MATRLRGLLNKTFAAAPSVTFLLSTVTTIDVDRCKTYHTARWHPGDCPEDMPTNIAAYNKLLPGIVAEYKGRGHDIALHEVNSAAQWTKADRWIWGIHFNQSGFEKMAAAWHTALMGAAPMRRSMGLPAAKTDDSLPAAKTTRRLQLPPPPPLPPIPVDDLLGRWTHEGDGSIVTVTKRDTDDEGAGGNASIVFSTACKPCCFKSGAGTVSTDGRFLRVEASGPSCERLATGRVYEGADHIYIRWEAHSPEGKPAAWQNWLKNRTAN